MPARAGLALRIGLLLASSSVFLGCPNPNTYTTPRTVGSGHFQHTLAAEAWGFSIPTSSASSSTEKLSATVPTLPTYTLRIGLGDSWEIGARLANMTSLGADVKWNFAKSSGIDLALDPAFQVFALAVNDSNGANELLRVTYLYLPLLVGLNINRTVSVVLTPGLTWGFVSGASSTTNFTSGSNQASASTGAIGRIGLGFDFRIMPGFALHPEITFLRSLGGDSTLIYMAGIGLNFGAMPSYDDVGGGPPPMPAPAAPPPEDVPPPSGAAPPSVEPAVPAQPIPPPTM